MEMAKSSTAADDTMIPFSSFFFSFSFYLFIITPSKLQVLV